MRTATLLVLLSAIAGASPLNAQQSSRISPADAISSACGAVNALAATETRRGVPGGEGSR